MTGEWRWPPLTASGEWKAGPRLCSHQDAARGRQKDKDASPAVEAGIIFVNWQAQGARGGGLMCLLRGERNSRGETRWGRTGPFQSQAAPAGEQTLGTAERQGSRWPYPLGGTQ